MKAPQQAESGDPGSEIRLNVKGGTEGTADRGTADTAAVQAVPDAQPEELSEDQIGHTDEEAARDIKGQRCCRGNNACRKLPIKGIPEIIPRGQRGKLLKHLIQILKFLYLLYKVSVS